MDSKTNLLLAVKPIQIFGKRHIQATLLFFGAILAYAMRANLSVGIVAMMSKHPPDPNIPTYPNWTNKDVLLSSFFWGYVIPQIGAGQLAEKFGPKWFLVTTMTIASSFTILIPYMASIFGSSGVLVNRIIQGMSQGFLFPSIHNLLSRWTPLSERSRFATFVYAGGPLGTVISMASTGLIANSKAGWPAAFYTFGGLGLFWVVIFSWLACNSPASHSTITEQEKNYIAETIKKEPSHVVATPWKHIFTSLPAWAIIIAHMGNNWGFWTLLTEIPSFMDNVLNQDMANNSLWSALPYLVYFLLSFCISPIADLLIVRNILTIAEVRKIFNSLGFFIPAVALIALGFVNQNVNLSIALLVVAVGTNAGGLCGFNLNHIDISPLHAGTLMGISNCAANVASLIGPLVVNVIVTDATDITQWRYVFMSAAVIYTLSGIFFNIFGAGTVQPWNNLEENNKSDIETGHSKTKEANLL